MTIPDAYVRWLFRMTAWDYCSRCLFQMPVSDDFSGWLFRITVPGDYFGCLFQMIFPDECFGLIFQMFVSDGHFGWLFQMIDLHELIDQKRLNGNEVSTTYYFNDVFGVERLLRNSTTFCNFTTIRTDSFFSNQFVFPRPVPVSNNY